VFAAVEDADKKNGRYWPEEERAKTLVGYLLNIVCPFFDHVNRLGLT
jgi:hypothetical protein